VTVGPSRFIFDLRFFSIARDSESFYDELGRPLTDFPSICRHLPRPTLMDFLIRVFLLFKYRVTSFQYFPVLADLIGKPVRIDQLHKKPTRISCYLLPFFFPNGAYLFFFFECLFWPAPAFYSLSPVNQLFGEQLSTISFLLLFRKSPLSELTCVFFRPGGFFSPPPLP